MFESTTYITDGERLFEIVLHEEVENFGLKGGTIESVVIEDSSPDNWERFLREEAGEEHTRRIPTHELPNYRAVG